MGTSISLLTATSGRSEQVTDTATGLSDLPLPIDVQRTICRLLSLRDRICLSSTCRALRKDLASREDAWGTLEFTKLFEGGEKLSSILKWLAHQRPGLRRLELDYFSVGGKVPPQAATDLAASLEGSSLLQFRLSQLKVLGEEGGAALQWLGSCTALTSLTLEDCSLRCLPGILVRLPALAELSLDGNRKLGEASWERLQQLSGLTRLDISDCRLTALPAQMSVLPALADLSLAGNKVDRSSWGRLRCLTALTRLDICGCGLAALMAELAALPALAALDLGRNFPLSAAGEEAWAPLIECTGLTSLGLRFIQFAWLPAALTDLAPHLVDLDLEGLCEQGLWFGGEATLAPLFRLTGLTRLNLSSSLEGLPLPEGLSCLVVLQDLDVSYSWYLGNGLPLHPLCHLTALTRLNLYGCGLKDLPEEISRLQALKDLDFGSNPLDHWVNPLQHISRLTAITRLNLERCMLGWLVPELAEMRSLEELNLGRNELLGFKEGESATAVTTKWSTLEQLTALTRLDAGSCNLPAVPAVFTALLKLRVLGLAGNPQLGSGGVPALYPLLGMTALQHLDLSGCNLPRALEVDAIPFPLHRLEGWAGE